MDALWPYMTSKLVLEAAPTTQQPHRLDAACDSLKKGFKDIYIYIFFSLFPVKKEKRGNENIARNKRTRAGAFLRSAAAAVPANATHTHGQAGDAAHSTERRIQASSHQSQAD